MFFKLIKYVFLIVLVVVVIVAAVATPFVISARHEGERMYEKYAKYTNEVLANNLQLVESPVKPEFQKLHPWKFLKLFRIVVSSKKADRLARINSLDASMFLFMKMYTLMIRPDYQYNLPMLSVDLIFIGGKRVFVIEVIDPAKIEDGNIKTHYAKMRRWLPEVAKFQQSTTRDWYKDYLTDFSIHIQADKASDDVLFEIYKTYLTSYLDMANAAQPLPPEKSAKVQAGIERYVDTLLSRGGPAVDVFRQMLGVDGQREYVRTVMFGLD